MEINTPAVIGPGEFFPVVGVGPHEKPWPTGDQYDPELLENGDRRNVLDHYRYWSIEAIVADLDSKRHKLQIAIENWQHDLNIGSVVRTANAFNVAMVHIIGKRDWNKRGAMVTDRYLHVLHHPTVADFAQWCKENEVRLSVSIMCLLLNTLRAQRYQRNVFFSLAKRVLECQMKVSRSAKCYMPSNNMVLHVL